MKSCEEVTMYVCPRCFQKGGGSKTFSLSPHQGERCDCGGKFLVRASGEDLDDPSEVIAAWNENTPRQESR